MEFIKLTDGRVIPSELVLQLKNINEKQFYNHTKDIWKYPSDSLYAIIDKDHKIKGFFWYQDNVMNNSIFINSISICNDWKNTGKVKEVADFIKKDMLQKGLTKALFLTDKPAFYEKMGLVKTGEVLLIGDFENGFS